MIGVVTDHPLRRDVTDWRDVRGRDAALRAENPPLANGIPTGQSSSGGGGGGFGEVTVMKRVGDRSPNHSTPSCTMRHWNA